MIQTSKCMECEEDCEVELVEGQKLFGVICDDCSYKIFGDFKPDLDENGEPREWTQEEIDEFNKEKK